MQASNQVFEAFWTTAQSKIAQDQFQLAPGCYSLLWDFLKNAADAYASSAAHGNLQSELDNVSRFVQAMIHESTAAVSLGQNLGAPEFENYSVLHEWSFDGARNRFCPCFPFC